MLIFSLSKVVNVRRKKGVDNFFTSSPLSSWCWLKLVDSAIQSKNFIFLGKIIYNKQRNNKIVNHLVDFNSTYHAVENVRFEFGVKEKIGNERN